MEDLRQLVQIIERRRADEILLLDPKSKNNKEWKLYESIVSGSVTTDEQAINLLYENKSSNAGYKMLKSRLRKKLMNQLFFLDLQGAAFPTALAQELDCYLKIYQAKALLNSGAYDIAILLLKQILSVALKYEYNNIIDICYRSMLEAYSNLRDKSNFYKTKKVLEELQSILEADRDSEVEYQEAQVEIGHSVSTRKAYLEKIDDKLRSLEAIWLKTQTYNTFFHYHNISSWSYELKGEYDKLIELTHVAEELLAANKINANRFDTRFNKYIQVYAYLRTQRYEEGLRLASQYESFFNSSSNNWFAFMENYLLLALHSKKYEIAHLILRRVHQNPFFKKITKLAHERWALFEAYLHYVSPSADRPFHLQALMQNLPSYSKDKEGYNVAILILQVMYYLQKYDVEALAYRTEALKKYAHKHFKDSFSERSRLFFRLLTVMVQANFDPAISEKKGKNIFLKLSQTTPPGDAYAEIEIIPYEHLWELILERLYQLSKVKR